MDPGVLSGTRILVLEDEFLIAMDVEQLCRDHGAEDVSVVRSIAETERAGFGLRNFDVAILDVMVDGQSSLPFATRLREAQVPFLFASGYAGLDEVFAGFPGIRVIGKPYAERELIGAVVSAMEPRARPS